MKIIFSTNKNMMFLAYFQKIIATILALAFSLYYLVPALQNSTNLEINTIYIVVLVCILVFELILHFGLSSFVQGLINKELRIIDVIGACLTFTIIFYISLHSTQTNPLLSKNNQQRFINIDSLHKVHGEVLSQTNKENSRRVNEFEKQSNTGLLKLQDNTWAYLAAVKSYETNKASLLSEIKEQSLKLENNYKSNLQRAEAKNKELKNNILEKASTENNKSTWLGLVVLVFSIYSTIVVGSYKKVQKKEVQDTEIQPKKRKRSTNINIVVQNTEVLQQTNNNIVLAEMELQTQEVTPTETQTIEITHEQPKKIRSSNARSLATEFMQTNDFLTIKKDKDRFELVQKEFGISWGTYSDIKRVLKEK
jgi:protein-S-isoprenylcysteine O-methyltransferase Ste14